MKYNKLIIASILSISFITFSFAQECPYTRKKNDRIESLKANVLADLKKDYDSLSKADKDCLSAQTNGGLDKVRSALTALTEQAVPDVRYVSGLTFGGRKVKCTEKFSDFKYHLDTEIVADVALMFDLVDFNDFYDSVTKTKKTSFSDTISKLQTRLPIKGTISTDLGNYLNRALSDCFVASVAASDLYTPLISNQNVEIKNQLETTILSCVSEKIYGGATNQIGSATNSDSLLKSKVQGDWTYGCSVNQGTAEGVSSITESLAETNLILKQREIYNRNLLDMYSTLNNMLAGTGKDNSCSSGQKLRNLALSVTSLGVDYLTLNSAPAIIALSQLGATVVNRIIAFGSDLFGDGLKSDTLGDALKSLTPENTNEIFKRYACHLWNVNSLGCEIETRKKIETISWPVCPDEKPDTAFVKVLNFIKNSEDVMSGDDITQSGIGSLSSLFYKKSKDKSVPPSYEKTELFEKMFGDRPDSFINVVRDDDGIDAFTKNQTLTAFSTLKTFIDGINPTLIPQTGYADHIKGIQAKYKEMKASLSGSQSEKVKKLSPVRYFFSQYQEAMFRKSTPEEAPMYLNMLYQTVADQYLNSKEQAVNADNISMTSEALGTVRDINRALLTTEFSSYFKDDTSTAVAYLKNVERKDLTAAADTIFEEKIFPILRECLASYNFGIDWNTTITLKSSFKEEYLARCGPLLKNCDRKYNIPSINADEKMAHFEDPSITERPFCKVIKSYDGFISGVAEEFRKDKKICGNDPFTIYKDPESSKRSGFFKFFRKKQ